MTETNKNTPPREQVKTDYEILIEMADDFQAKSNELAVIRNEKSSAVLMLMANSKSVKEAELKWQATPQGKNETTLVYYLKGLEKRMSALRAQINGNRAY